jgi:hypothetical protein
MKTLQLFCLVAFIMLLSCKSDDDAVDAKVVPTGETYLIFGHFFGECYEPECVVNYKLTDSKLYEDVNHSAHEEYYEFIELDNDTFEQINDLMDSFPEELLDETERFIGTQQGSEPAVIVIYYFHNDVLRHWIIEKYKNDVPNYLHPFVDKVNEKIELLIN